MPVLLFPWCLLNSCPELHSDFLVFIHVPLFTFQQSLHLWFAFKSHDLTLVPHAPGLLYPALHFRSVKAQALRGCILECKAPSCRGRSDFNSAIHSFICSFLHYFLSMWAPTSRNRDCVGYTVTLSSFLLCKKREMTKLFGGSEIRHVKHPVKCLVHNSNAQ